MLPTILALLTAAPLPVRPAAVRLLPPAPVPESQYDGLPPLTDLERFPSKDVAEAALAWLDRHLAWLEAQASLDLVYPEYWSGWIEDVKESRRAWQLLLTIYTPHVNESDRVRLALLRKWIGEEAYGVGRMPMPPLWRFRWDR